MTSGVYVIVHQPTGHFYLGSSLDMQRRWTTHKRTLDLGTHRNGPLQAAWSESGGRDAFSFQVLCEVPPDQVLSCEARLLGRLVGRADCFNIAIDPSNGMRGRRHRPEVVARMAESNRIAHARPETKERMRLTRLGKPLSQIQLQACREASKKRRGCPIALRSAEHREKLSLANRGKKPSPLAIERSVAAREGKPLSAAHRAKLVLAWAERRKVGTANAAPPTTARQTC